MGLGFRGHRARADHGGGSVYATGASGTDLVAARYDGAGTRLWSTLYNLGGTERGFALRLVGGTLYVAGSAGADALVVGFNPETGAAGWKDVYDGGQDDAIYAMAFTGTSDFWVAGSSGSDLLTVEYTLPAGATSARFTITGTAVTSPQSGSVTAIYGGVSQSAVLTVRPIGVATLAVSPNPVVGPAMTQGTVTLECPAGPGGVVVTLSPTGSTSVARPAMPSLTVPAGATSATFAILTLDVSIESYANVRATAAGVWKSVKVTVLD